MKSQNFSAASKPGIGFVDVSEVIPKPDSEKIASSLVSSKECISLNLDNYERMEKSASCNSLRKIISRLLPCPKKCSLRITENDQKQISNFYWSQNTKTERFNFLYDMLEISERPNSIYKYDIKYHLNTDKGRQEVCKSCFGIVLGEKDDDILSVIRYKLTEIKSKNLYLCFSYVPNSNDT